MHFKQKLMYMTFGGLLVLAGYILRGQDSTFGKIVCRDLEVVDDEGKVGVRLTIEQNG